MRKYRGCRNHARTPRQRFRKRLVAIVGSPIDQQQINGDDLRLQSRDRIDNPGKIDARERVTSTLLDHGVVDRDDGDEVRRNPDAASQRSKIGHGGFDAIEKAEMTALVREIHSRPPEAAQEHGNQCLEMSTTHPLYLL